MIDPEEIQKRINYSPGLCRYFLDHFGWKASAGSVAGIAAAVDSLDSPTREVVLVNLSLGSLDFLEKPWGITSLGGYFLGLEPARWVELIAGEYEGGTRCNGALAAFLARHSKQKLLEILPHIVGRGKLVYGDMIANHLYREGLKEAEGAALSAIRSKESEFHRFLGWCEMCKIDFERHREEARLAAYESLAGSPATNNRHVPAVWLAEHFPEEALPKLCELIRNEGQNGASFSKVAYDVLSSLGVKADPVLEACAATTWSHPVQAGASGAIRGGYKPPNPTISGMLRRLLKVDDVRTRTIAIENIGRWDPGDFVEELETLAATASDAEEVQAARWVLARHNATQLGLTGFDRDRYLLDQMFAGTPLEDHAALFQGGLKPCLHIRSRVEELPLPPEISRIGGSPSLPDGVEWPRTSHGTPMTFIASISARDMNLLEPDFRGCLLSFAEWEQMEGSIVVVEEGSERTASSVPDDLTANLNECALEFRANLCLPQHDDHDALTNLGIDKIGRKNHDAIRELLYRFEGREPGERTAVHRLFGYPRFTQSSPISSPDPDQPEEWMSILTMETDGAAGLHFYDTGTLTFILRRADWEAKDFSRVGFWADFM